VITLLSLAYAVDRPVGPGQTYASVEDAVQGASNGDVILIDAGTYPTPAMQFAGRTLTFRASGTGTVVIEATTGNSLFRVNGGGIVLDDVTLDGLGARQLVEANNSDVTITDSTLRNGTSPGNGGLVTATGTVLVTDSTLAEGTATGAGGLLDVNGDLTLTRTVLTAGQAPTGAAVRVTGDLVASESVFSEHVGTDGGLWCGAGCDVSDSRFQDNNVTRGGAILLTGSDPSTLSGLVVCGNSGSDVLDVEAGTVTLDRSLVFDNAVLSGTLHIGPTATASIVNTHLVGNTATSTGAAVEAQGSLTLRNTLVAQNTGLGPAIAATGPLIATYNLYFDNQATDSSAAADPTELFVDPLLAGFVPGSCDPAGITPLPGSPVTDAGDPALLDDDGSRSDIGAFVPGLVPFVDNDSDGVEAALDCNDDDPLIYPGAPEIPCSGIDEDCDATTLDAVDDDSDGVTTCDGDCDDSDVAIGPFATDVLCSGVDEDCDPATPDDRDADSDGVSFCDADCDDDDAQRNPNAVEQPCSGVDEDCDPLTPDAPDADGDGTSVCDGDCLDTDAGVSPTSAEIPYDGIDQDCSGADLDDVDADGFALGSDCDDDDPSIFPGAIDLPEDAVDQDCTGFDVTTDLTGRLGYRCGCSATSPRSFGWVFLVALAVFRRRQSAV
jgi:hypothetical protein